MHDLILHPLIKVWYLLLLLIFHQKTFLKCFPKFHSWLIYHLWYFSRAKDHMLLLSSLQFSHFYHLLIQFLLYLNQYLFETLTVLKWYLILSFVWIKIFNLRDWSPNKNKLTKSLKFSENILSIYIDISIFLINKKQIASNQRIPIITIKHIKINLNIPATTITNKVVAELFFLKYIHLKKNDHLSKKP